MLWAAFPMDQNSVHQRSLPLSTLWHIAKLGVQSDCGSEHKPTDRCWSQTLAQASLAEGSIASLSGCSVCQERIYSTEQRWGTWQVCEMENVKQYAQLDILLMSIIILMDHRNSQYFSRRHNKFTKLHHMHDKMLLVKNSYWFCITKMILKKSVFMCW